jgi:hypothetical protein
MQAKVRVGNQARLHWSADGRFAVAGTQDGEVHKIDREGQVVWRTRLPVADPPPAREFRPAFPEVPVYSVGRLGPEHADVGDNIAHNRLPQVFARMGVRPPFR